MTSGRTGKLCLGRKSGITLMEILVAMVLLSMVMMGFTNVFLSSKQLIFRSANKMKAVEFARCILDPLNNAVRQDTWNNATVNNLTLGNRAGVYQVVNNVNYTSVYNVTNATTATNLASGVCLMRKVKVTITWNETKL